MLNDDQRIQEELKLVASLPDIMPDQADEAIAPIYESIQQTLRVPIVNLIFRTLANYPEYLRSVWWDIQPLLSLQTFEEAADSLREKALLEPSSPESDLLKETDSVEKLRSFNDSIHYVLPKLLLIATALSEGEFGDTHRNEDLSVFPSLLPGIAPEAAKVKMLNPEKADEKVKSIFDSVKSEHDHPLVSSYYRALGNWPEFLDQAWKRVKPSLQTEGYTEKKKLLIDEALLKVRGLPSLVLSEVDITPAQKAEIQKVLRAFRYDFIPEMMIDVGQIKCLIDGPESAKSSPLSLGKNREWDH